MTITSPALSAAMRKQGQKYSALQWRSRQPFRRAVSGATSRRGKSKIARFYWAILLVTTWRLEAAYTPKGVEPLSSGENQISWATRRWGAL